MRRIDEALVPEFMDIQAAAIDRIHRDGVHVAEWNYGFPVGVDLGALAADASTVAVSPGSPTSSPRSSPPSSRTTGVA